MPRASDAIISDFEAKCIRSIMSQGFNRSEAKDIFDDWLTRTAKRRQALKLQMKMSQIR